MMNDKGLTLVEVMMATAILSIILVSVTLSFMQGSDQVAYELPRDELGTSMQNIIEKIGEILCDARVVDIAPDGSWIDFQTPVDPNNRGCAFTALDPFTIDWGVAKGIGPGAPQLSAETGSISFLQRGGGLVLSEPLLQKNINANTETVRDMADVFDLGEMVLTSSDDVNWQLRLGGAFILQPSRNWGGDIDGEGTPDPIFSGTGKRLTLRLMMGRAPMGVPAILVARTVTIFLRNQDQDLAGL